MKRWLKTLWCKWTHKGPHTLIQIEYGGGYITTCHQCGSYFYMHR